tara:strand:- start:11171 stop:11440 length:270 start_codon:yes stop_codon:yes gene_type:complete
MCINIETKTATNASIRIALSHAGSLEKHAGETYLFFREGAVIVDMDDLRSRFRDDDIKDDVATEVIQVLKDFGMTAEQIETVEYLQLWL